MERKWLFYLILGLFIASTTGIGEASSPDEWVKYEKEVASKCVKACGLKKAQVVGDIVFFDDERVGFDAVMIRGRYSQPQMKNAEGYALCLFNKRTRQAECNEANQWFNPARP